VVPWTETVLINVQHSTEMSKTTDIYVQGTGNKILAVFFQI